MKLRLLNFILLQSFISALLIANGCSPGKTIAVQEDKKICKGGEVQINGVCKPSPTAKKPVSSSKSESDGESSSASQGGESSGNGDSVLEDKAANNGPAVIMKLGLDDKQQYIAQVKFDALKTQLTKVSYQYKGDVAFKAKAESNVIKGTEVGLPVVVKFEFDGKQCLAEGRAKITEESYPSICE